MKPETTITVRWTPEEAAAFNDAVRTRPAYVALPGGVRIESRRWAFPNGFGIAATRQADAPLPGRCPLPGSVPEDEWEWVLTATYVSSRDSDLAVDFAGVKGEPTYVGRYPRKADYLLWTLPGLEEESATAYFTDPDTPEAQAFIETVRRLPQRPGVTL